MTDTNEHASKYDYSTWTYEDHLAQVEKLAAQADEVASIDQVPSLAARHRESILQTTARGQLHASLATLKKPQSAAPEPVRQTRQRAEKNTES